MGREQKRGWRVKQRLFCCALLVACCLGSSGDVDWSFRACVGDCIDENTCVLRNTGWPSLAKWNCEELCLHNCAQDISAERARRGLPILKYFGHWSFERWLGLEEPASVLFSLLNPIPHVLFLLRRLAPEIESHYIHARWVYGYAIVAVNAWMASCCYHSKKTHFSTHYDLISALVLIVYGVVMATIFLAAEFPARAWRLFSKGVAFAALAFVSQRVYAMVKGRVSFSHHMNTCIFLMGLSTAAWFAWMWKVWRIRSQSDARNDASSARWCLLVQVWLLLSALLEILDFPPFLNTFDAHSLWHAATVPLGFIWYKFLRSHAAELALKPRRA